MSRAPQQLNLLLRNKAGNLAMECIAAETCEVGAKWPCGISGRTRFPDRETGFNMQLDQGDPNTQTNSLEYKGRWDGFPRER